MELHSILPRHFQNFNEFENIDLSLFFDAANLWYVDYDNSLDADKIRSSTGVAIDWFTAIDLYPFHTQFQ